MSLKVVKFSAVWCGPCQVLQPIWDKIVESRPEVEFVVVDVDSEPKLTQKYQISAVPTILFIKNNSVVDCLTGLHKESTIRTKIDLLIKTGV